MAQFDVAAGITRDTMNTVGQVVYQKIYSDLFNGSATVEKGGIQITVGMSRPHRPSS